LAVDRLHEDDPEALAAITAAATPGLEAILAEAPAEGDARVPQLAVRAKDAAFHLASKADADSRARLGAAMLAWYAADYARRATAGDVSGKQVADAYGDEGAQMLVRALDEHLPNELLPRLVAKVTEIGAAET